MLLNVKYHTIYYQDETSIYKSVLAASGEIPLDIVILTTGILDYGELMPEKSQKNYLQKSFIGYSR